MRNDGKMSEYRKTDDTLISVIVPVYKVEQYLEKCVNSISVQTYSNLDLLTNAAIFAILLQRKTTESR